MTIAPTALKNYVGLGRDHSGSMSGIARAACADYNSTVASMTEEAAAQNIDTVVSVVKCGTGRPAKNVWEVRNSSVAALKPLQDYETTGNATPLFDSVVMLIDELKKVPDYTDPNVSFLVMSTTDGGDNDSSTTGRQLGAMIKELQATDRWTFVFRVPKGDKAGLVSMGIPGGNILEWEQSERGAQAATVATKSAMKGFYAARSMGATSTSKFYADLSEVSLTEVKAALVDISKQVDVYMVEAKNDGVQIKDFVQAQGIAFTKGCAFYELSKTETVQDYKQIAVRDKQGGAVYSGIAARDLLGLPHHGECKLAPGQHGQYEIFVQSTSVNRKLVKGTNLMIWVGVPA